MFRLWRLWFRRENEVATYVPEVLESGWVPPLPSAVADMPARPADAGATAPVNSAGADAEAPELLERFYVNQGC
ncbi:MAG: hypothetical protein FJY55_12410 [Betaproteobacteria bacterium]|nr:hypothetical protein [Betaproteobacteria bacterium]